MTIHSSLAAISVVCDEITAMDLQKHPLITPQKQKQKSVLRTSQIWVSTPKIAIPAHTFIESRAIDREDTNDRMIDPRIPKQIQKNILTIPLPWMRAPIVKEHRTLFLLLFRRGLISR